MACGRPGFIEYRSDVQCALANKGTIGCLGMSGVYAKAGSGIAQPGHKLVRIKRAVQRTQRSAVVVSLLIGPIATLLIVVLPKLPSLP